MRYFTPAVFLMYLYFSTQVLPEFTQRLKQREFDFILTSPVRRRLLLKLFIVSCFTSKRRDTEDATGGDEGRGGTAKVLHRLWRPISGSNTHKNGSISDEGIGGDDMDELDSDDEDIIFDGTGQYIFKIHGLLRSKHLRESFRS